jgi:CubicO group peptidase (beta-lactamase class C family)
MYFFRLIGLSALTFSFALAAETAPAAALAARIARVESGLLPPARLTGAAAEPWTITRRQLIHRVPAVSIAVIADGQLSWARAYGLARVGDPATVNADTLFQAATLSKPVAAAGFLTLVDAGKLTLDTGVNTALTSWKIPPPPSETPASELVTLRRLLSHTAGFTVPAFAGYAASAPHPTLLQILDGLAPANSAPIRLEATPGTKWRYSGGGFVVAQQLALDSSGESFPDLLRTRVLIPAGMTASTFAQPLSSDLAPRAAGHIAGTTRVAGDAHVYPELAASGLWTTPTDLARFALALRASLDGQPGFLTRATATAMITPPLADTNYGLGIGVLGSGENLQLAHTGSSEGFRCSFVFYPRLGRGAIVMTNSDQGGALIPEILRAISREYAWPDYRMVEKTAVPLTASAISAFSGRYERENTPVLVFHLNGHFYIRIGDRPRFEIFPQSDHEFFTLDSPDIWSFERGPRGNASHIVLRSAPPQLYRRVSPPAPSPILAAPRL